MKEKGGGAGAAKRVKAQESRGWTPAGDPWPIFIWIALKKQGRDYDQNLWGRGSAEGLAAFTKNNIFIQIGKKEGPRAGP